MPLYVPPAADITCLCLWILGQDFVIKTLETVGDDLIVPVREKQTSCVCIYGYKDIVRGLALALTKEN